jgi:hypothetical protein
VLLDGRIELIVRKDLVVSELEVFMVLNEFDGWKGGGPSSLGDLVQLAAVVLWDEVVVGCVHDQHRCVDLLDAKGKVSKK